MRTIAKLFSGPAMIAAGVNHFVSPRLYEKIMPSWIPAHRELVYASGVAEIAAGGLTLHPRTRRAGGWLLILTLLGVSPVHLDMVARPSKYPGIPVWGMWARLPVQGVFLYWAYLANLTGEAPDGALARLKDVVAGN